MLGEVSPSDSDCETVRSQSFSVSRSVKRSIWKVKEICMQRVHPKVCSLCQERGHKTKMGSGLESGCKKDAELLGQQ